MVFSSNGGAFPAAGIPPLKIDGAMPSNTPREDVIDLDVRVTHHYEIDFPHGR